MRPCFTKESEMKCVCVRERHRDRETHTQREAGKERGREEGGRERERGFLPAVVFPVTMTQVLQFPRAIINPKLMLTFAITLASTPSKGK